MVQQTTKYLLITWFPLNKRAANRIFTWLSHVLILRKYWQEKSHYLPFYCMERSILVALITIFQMEFVLCFLICLHVCAMQIKPNLRQGWTNTWIELHTWSIKKRKSHAMTQRSFRIRYLWPVTKSSCISAPQKLHQNNHLFEICLNFKLSVERHLAN